MSLERLWAGWRGTYVSGLDTGRPNPASACSAGSSRPTTTKRARARTDRAHDRGDEPVPVRVGPPDGRAGAARRQHRRSQRRRDDRARASRSGARSARSARRTSPTASTSAPTSAAPPARASRTTCTCTCCPAGRRHQLHDVGRRSARAARAAQRRATTSCASTGPSDSAQPSRRDAWLDRRRTRGRRAARRPRRHRVRRAVHVPRHQAAPHRRDDLRGPGGPVPRGGSRQRQQRLPRSPPACSASPRSTTSSPRGRLRIDQTEALAGRESGPSASRSAMRRRSSPGAACAAARPGASCSTAPTNRRACADSWSSTRSTAACSGSTPSTTPKTGRAISA